MLAGLAGATLAFWSTCAVFLRASPRFYWDGVLGATLPRAGSYCWETGEGVALTRWQGYGVSALPPIMPNVEHVLLWGDSHVEATHVPDSAKMHAQINARTADLNDSRGLPVLAIGISGAMVADYIVWMRAYEDLLPNVRQHLVLCTAADEFLPDRPDAYHAKFSSTAHGFEVVPETPRRASQLGRLAMDITYFGRLASIHVLMKSLRNAVTFDTMEFLPTPAEQRASHAAPVPPPGRAAADDLSAVEAACRFSVGELAKQSDLPITVIYAPVVCSLDAGRYQWHAPDPRAQILQQACEQHGIAWVDVSEAFCDYTRRTGRFPRGFHNGRPAEGHFNRHGHRLIAEAVVDHLRQPPVCSSHK